MKITHDNIKLKYVLVREEELVEGGVILPRLPELFTDMIRNEIEVIDVSDGWQKPKEACLLLAATDALIEEGIRRDVAVIGFENADYPNESRMESPVLLQGFEEIDADYILHIWQRKQGIPWYILSTARCEIWELELANLDDLFDLYGQEGMTDYIEPLYSRPEEEEYQRAYIENMYRFYGYGMWMVWEKETGRLIGRAGLEHRELNGEWELELGYAIAPQFQRQGYATEICEGIMRYAWENLDYERINCLIEPENQPSIAFAEKLGFTYVGQIEENAHVYERYMMCRREQNDE